MSTTTHTPGPWEALPNSNMVRTARTQENADGLIIAECCLQREQCKSDARLIAAAPELLEALKELIAKIEDAHGRGHDICGMARIGVGDAYHAIRKAETGRS